MASPRIDTHAGLYVHVPFCSAVCPYCDFAVQVGSADAQRRFEAALAGEIALRAGDPRTFDTIYLGGGTPSLLPRESLERLLAGLRRAFRFAPDTRLFLEANPEDVTPDSLRDWRALGVHMLSLGVQSFADIELRQLGRRHDGAQARHAVEQACAAGFDIVSLDLIYGLPSQSAPAWQTNLEIAVACAPQHLSCYQLTIAEGTPFFRRARTGRLRELPDDDQGERFLQTHEFLAAAGYAGYEVSNFAHAIEHRSRHNQKYWRHVPYLGLGPSAHSFDGARRSWNARSLGEYCALIDRGALPEAGSEAIGTRELALETVMLSLRQPEGLDLAAYRRRFGIDLAELRRDEISGAVDAGLLTAGLGVLRPTLRGLAVADTLAVRLSLPVGLRFPNPGQE